MSGCWVLPPRLSRQHPRGSTRARVRERVSKQTAAVHDQASTRLPSHRCSANTGGSPGAAEWWVSTATGWGSQHLVLLWAMSGLGSVYPAGLGRRCCSLWMAVWNYLRMLSSSARLYLVLTMFAFTLGLFQRGYSSISPHREQKMVIALSSRHQCLLAGHPDGGVCRAQGDAPLSSAKAASGPGGAEAAHIHRVFA